MEKEELKRYNRHLILDQVGLAGQEKLKNAAVLVIGAGGLGCPALQYLTAAGVGRIGIIDFDTVDISNLQRQILYRSNDVGLNKAEAAAKNLAELNPFVKFESFPEKLTTSNALDIFDKYDLVLDGSDNFSTRYLVNDASLLAGKPLIYGSIYTFQGQVSVFNYNEGPSYRCLFPNPPKPGSVKNCSEIGVIGVLPGIIGTQQANEAIKIILEIGTPLSGKLLLYDSLNAGYNTMQFERSDESIEMAPRNREEFENNDYDFFCGIDPESKNNALQINDLINNLDVQLIDLREEWEEPRIEAANVIQITMDNLSHSIDQISRSQRVVLFCQTGARSAQVKTYLETTYQFDNLEHLTEGVENYGR